MHRSFEASGDEVYDVGDLPRSDAAVPIDDVLNARAPREILEDQGNRQTGVLEYPRPVDLLGVRFEKRALRPI